MKSRKMLAIALFLVVALVATSCSPAAQPTSAPAGDAEPTTAQPAAESPTAAPAPETVTTLHVMTFLAADSPEAEEAIMDGFEAEHPEYKVELEFVPFGEYFTTLETRIAGGAPPDVASLNMENVPSFASLGALAQLDPFIERDGYDLDQYYPATLRMHTYQDSLYGLPASFSTVVLFYNKALFDEAGLSYPDDTWTWDDMVANAKQLTKDTDGDGITDQFGYAKGWWPLYLWLNGADIFNEDRTECTLDEPEAIEGIQKMMDLWLVDKVAPTPADLSTQSDWDMFMNGHLAMYPVGPWGVAPFQETEFEWDIADHPGGKERATFLFGNCYAILAGSKNQDGAWELLKYAAGEKGERIRQEAGYEIAPVKVVAEGEFLSSMEGKMPAHPEVFTESTSYARSVPVVPGWNEITAAVDAELELASLGQKTVEEALTAAAVEVDALLSAAQ